MDESNLMVYGNLFYVEKKVEVESEDSLLVSKKDLKRIPYNCKRKNLIGHIFKNPYLREGHGRLTQRKNMNKLLWNGGYLMEKRKTSNLMVLKKEFPIKKDPTMKWVGRSYLSEMMHWSKNFRKSSVKEKNAHLKVYFKICTLTLLFHAILRVMLIIPYRRQILKIV